MSDLILMKQRVNLTPSMLNYWETRYKKETKGFNKFLLNEDDLKTIIVIEGRHFSIEGMLDNDNILLKENIGGEITYWECTYKLVQHKLGLFNKILKGGERDGEVIEYDTNGLYYNNKARKKRTFSKEKDEPILDGELVNALFEDDEISEDI